MVPPELGGEPKRDQYSQVAPDGAFFFNEQHILYTDRRSAALRECSADPISGSAAFLLNGFKKTAESKIDCATG